MDGYLHRIRHGGWCCGMSHIQGFHTSPGGTLPERKAMSLQIHTDHLRLHPAYINCVNESLPAQTGKERLAELIRRITEGVPGVAPGRARGIVEAVLAGATQHKNWHDELILQGFRLVTEHKNSNTNNTLHVYHLSTGA